MSTNPLWTSSTYTFKKVLEKIKICSFKVQGGNSTCPVSSRKKLRKILNFTISWFLYTRLFPAFTSPGQPFLVSKNKVQQNITPHLFLHYLHQKIMFSAIFAFAASPPWEPTSVITRLFPAVCRRPHQLFPLDKKVCSAHPQWCHQLGYSFSFIPRKSFLHSSCCLTWTTPLSCLAGLSLLKIHSLSYTGQYTKLSHHVSVTAIKSWICDCT